MREERGRLREEMEREREGGNEWGGGMGGRRMKTEAGWRKSRGGER